VIFWAWFDSLTIAGTLGSSRGQGGARRRTCRQRSARIPRFRKTSKPTLAKKERGQAGGPTTGENHTVLHLKKGGGEGRRE